VLILECPNCGTRNVQEFRYGGEYNPRPAEPETVDDEAWADYVHMRRNLLGVQKEWWYHRAGCGLWFLAERHTKSNEVMRTYAWEREQAP
jgi:sarcosine oxidase subunit delta